MMRSPLQCSLADLAAAGLPLSVSAAATIARELAVRTARGDLPGIPSPHVIRLDERGGILIEGPVASGREIERAARLLESLLPPIDAHSGVRVPGALRLVIARALRVLDIPPFESLAAFADALERFSDDEPVAAVRELVGAWRNATQPAEVPDAPAAEPIEGEVSAGVVASFERIELTISDIRRARRATRLMLRDIAERSRLPVDLIRELEWGYFANWPGGFAGRAQLVRYARAAGLDERVVLRVAVPLLDECHPDAAREEMVEPAVVAPPIEAVADEDALVPTSPQALPPVVHRRRRAPWLAALAIPALLAIGLLPGLISRHTEPDTPAVPVPHAATAPAATTPDASTPAATGPAASESSASTLPPSTPPPPSDTSAPSRATAEVARAAFSPAFATTGSAVFYHSGKGRQSAIMRADTGGSGDVLRVTRVIDDTASNFHARPSPDGTLIAFDSDRDGERGVYVARADGSEVRRVTGDGFAAVPSWSPDGRLLAYVRAERDRPNVWNIWTVDLESGEKTRITSHRVGQPWGATWFPDGKRIAYSHETRLVIRTLDGSRESSFASPVRGRLLRTPAVSPDGRHVVFQVYREGGWLLDVMTGRMRKVLGDRTAEEFTWSPDGRRIAYHSRRSGKWGIWVLDGAATASLHTQ